MDLGVNPQPLRIRLTKGAAFYCELRLADADEFFTAPPRLVFPVSDVTGPLVWAAEMSEQNRVATWNVDAVDVDLLIAASGDRHAHLQLGDIPWAFGKFEVRNPSSRGAQ